jgi:hypothetical protein
MTTIIMYTDYTPAVQALLWIAFKVPEMKVEIHGALQVGVLAVATGGSVQVSTCNAEPICDAFHRLSSFPAVLQAAMVL